MEHFGTERVQASGLAFPTVTGKPMRRSNFSRRIWRPTVERLGWADDHPLAGLVFQELRHTAAALAIAQDAHPLTIKERLGHSSITVTMANRAFARRMSSVRLRSGPPTSGPPAVREADRRSTSGR